MKITIIIPIYKVEPYIADCIRSVISQKNVDLDIILVDDCSPDNSVKIACDLLDHAGKSYQLVRHEYNRGLSAARNSGIRVAEGEYLYFLDSDDELMGAMSLASLLKVAIQTKADCVVGNYVTRIENSADQIAKYRTSRFFSPSESLFAYADTLIPIPAWNKLVKKSFVVSNDLYFKEGVLNEDELWSFQMALSRGYISLTGINSYLYKVRAGSIMRRDSISKWKAACQIYDLMVESFLDKLPESHKERCAVSKCLDYFAWYLYKELSSIDAVKSEKRLLYGQLRSIQLRYPGFGEIRWLRSLHIYFPISVAFLMCLLMMRIIEK